MKIETTKLIQDLRSLTQKAKDSVIEFKQLSLEELNYKSSPTDWSILECIDHLNRYGNFYLPELEKQMLSAKEAGGQSHFKSGVIGNYFVNMIKATNTKKIKATQEMDSTGSDLNTAAIDQFIKQLGQLDALLIDSRRVNLTKVKTAISLSKLIKLRMGDTLRFLVYHNERHILQAQRVKIRKAS